MITNQKPATTRHTSKRGTIIYKIDNSGFPEGVWGREYFILTCHGDGDRVLRAYCELDDDPLLVRDVIQRVDADFHPQDAVVRLTEGDSFKGTSWYLFTDHEAEMQGFNIEDGRTSETIEIDRSVRGFGNHSLMGDAWLVAKFDRTEGPRQHTFYDNPLTSIDHRGATGPRLERSKASTFEYFGNDMVTVTAGEFRCHHFAFVQVSNNHPPYHLWVTADGDYVFVKGIVDAPYNWSFELTEFLES